MTPETIKKVIRRNGKTQRYVAEHMGITPQSLYERLQASSISTNTLEDIADALGISPAEFYEEDIYAQMREENERLRKLVEAQMKTISTLLNGRKVEKPLRRNTKKSQ